MADDFVVYFIEFDMDSHSVQIVGETGIKVPLGKFLESFSYILVGFSQYQGNPVVILRDIRENYIKNNYYVNHIPYVPNFDTVKTE